MKSFQSPSGRFVRMLALLQHSVTLTVAILLAVGPAYCRMQCQAAEVAVEEHLPSCCLAKTASPTPEPSEQPVGGCSCEVHPKAIDARGDQQWTDALGTALPAAYPLEMDPWLPVIAPRTVAADIPPPVSLHVLKCVWRC